MNNWNFNSTIGSKYISFCLERLNYIEYSKVSRLSTFYSFHYFLRDAIFTTWQVLIEGSQMKATLFIPKKAYPKKVKACSCKHS